MFPTLRKRLGIWLAILALLVSAFASMASHAPLRRVGGMWEDICTATGTQPSVVDVSGSSAPQPDPGMHAADCAYCLVQADGWVALLVSSVTPPLPAEERGVRIAVRYPAPWPSLVWEPAVPRAPPAAD
jgi:hypothetical protein